MFISVLETKYSFTPSQTKFFIRNNINVTKCWSLDQSLCPAVTLAFGLLDVTYFLPFILCINCIGSPLIGKAKNCTVLGILILFLSGFRQFLCQTTSAKILWKMS